MKKNIPVYAIEVSEESESFVDAIALVEKPAIELDFIAFSKQEDLKFAVDEEKMELIGPALVPDLQIYRIDPKTNEPYYVTFSKETIRTIAQIYLKKGFQRDVNIEHSVIPAKSYLFQSYIVDESKGLSAPKGISVPDGSWIVGMKVEDYNIWNGIKEGKVKGFSVEGFFKLVEMSKQPIEKSEEEQVLDLLRQLNEKLTTTK
jgi:hypothetical protein